MLDAMRSGDGFAATCSRPTGRAAISVASRRFPLRSGAGRRAMIAPIIYHGTPLTPRAALLNVLAGRAGCVSFFRPDDAEAVEAVCPQIMFRQRGVFILATGPEGRAGMGAGSRLDAVLRVAGAEAVLSGPLCRHPRQPWRAVPAQRWAAERLAIRTQGRSALAHGRADRAAWQALREVPAGLPGMGWDARRGGGAGRWLRCLHAPHGGSGSVLRERLAGPAHDARDFGCSAFPVPQGGRNQLSSERASL